MNSIEQFVERVRQNPGNWADRAELAHAWREGGIEFHEEELLAGAMGAPRNRRELQRILDALAGAPAAASWERILDEYLRWAPGCPLGLASLAHVLEAQGKTDEAISMYEMAVAKDRNVAEPVLLCLRQDTESDPLTETEEEPRQKLLQDSRFFSLTVALAAHLILILILSFWVVYAPSLGPPRLIVSAPAEEESLTPAAPAQKKPTSTVAQPNSMEVISTTAFSDMAVSLNRPEASQVSTPFLGTDFSPSMNFGQSSGGSVSFFGSSGETRKLVYVVDVSGSMSYQGENGKTRIQLLKEELKRSVNALPLSVQFQIIFFSNMGWFAGDDPAAAGFVSEGADDPDNYPSRPLVRATQSQKRRTLQHIDDVMNGGGTNWRLPLKMAMKLEPDLIYFMTDGEIDTDAGEVPVIDDVVDYNRSKGRAKIKAICLMELKAYEKLQELANRTRGDVFLVQEDGTVLRGMQLDQIRK